MDLTRLENVFVALVRSDSRLETAFRFEDLETSISKASRFTLRPLDRADASALAQRFGFRWDEKERS